MKDKRWSNLSVARDDVRGRVAQQRARDQRRAMIDLQREISASPPAQPQGARPVYDLDGVVTDLGLSAEQERKARKLVGSVVTDTRSMFGVGKAALDMGLNKYQMTELLRRAHEMKQNMDVRKGSPVAPHGADRPDAGKKPPSGFTPIPGGKKGGYHRKTTDGSGGYDYWYPGIGIVSSPHDEDHGDVHERHEKSKPKPEVAEESKKVHALAKKHGMTLDFHPHGGTTMEDVNQIKAHVEHGLRQQLEADNDAPEDDAPEDDAPEDDAPEDDAPEDDDADNEGADTDEDEFEDDDPTEEVPRDALSGEEGPRDFGPSDEADTDEDDDEPTPIAYDDDGNPIYDEDDYFDDDEEPRPEDEFHPADMEFGEDGLPVDHEPPANARELAEMRFKIDQLTAALEQSRQHADAQHQQMLEYLQAQGQYVRQNPTRQGLESLFHGVWAFLNLAIPTALGAAIGGPAGAVLGAAYGAKMNKRNQYRVKGSGTAGPSMMERLDRFLRLPPQGPRDRLYAKGGVYYDPSTDRLVVATADNDLAKADSYKVPEGARGNARKVLEWKKKHGSEVRGMTPVGWARARQLASQTHVGLDTVKRMSAFNRHRQNATVDPKHASEPWKDRGYVAWLGWGGSTGVDWARRITGAADKAEEGADNDLAKAQRPTGSGWAPVPRGMKGGYRKPKSGGGFEYWYPDGRASSKHVSHHNQRHEEAKTRHDTFAAKLEALPEDSPRRGIYKKIIASSAEEAAMHGDALSAASAAVRREAEYGVRHDQAFKGKRTLGIEEGVIWSAVADGLGHNALQPVRDGSETLLNSPDTSKGRPDAGEEISKVQVGIRTVTGLTKNLPVRFVVSKGGFHGHMASRQVAKYDPRTDTYDHDTLSSVPAEIVVFCPPTGHMSPDKYREQVRHVLAHEMSHALDELTGAHKKRNKSYGDHGEGYYNDPSEVVAYRHNVFRELNTPEVVEDLKELLSVFAMDEEELADLKEWKRSQGESTLGARTGPSNLGEDEVLTMLRKHSPTWTRINRHLTKRNQRKFLETAAATLSAHVDGTSTPMAKSDAKKTPAKPHERRTGSSRNKPGSAATASGGVELSAATIETLKGKVKSHNESSSKKVTLGQLKSVYRRGSGAFSTSHHPNANRHSWSMGRVNSFLRRVKGGDGHSQDDDLISKAGPYIGPRGGKWADPQHKIPWDEEGGDKQGVHREISRDKAAAAIIDGIPNNVRAGWLRNADRAYKPKIEQAIVSNPELHNAALNILHQQYQIGTGKKVSFEEFLDTPIKLYRAGKTPATEAFSSYSYDKDMADGFSKQYGVETHSITIKPRDTYGMINEMAEGEVLVPLKSEHSDKFQQGEALTIRGHKWNVVKRAGRQVHLQRADKPDSKPTVMAEDRLARHLSKSRRRRPPPPQVLAKARAVREVQRAARARRPKNEHGHRDGLTPGDTLTLRKSHATADSPDHVIVRAGGKFQWGDTIYPNARRLLAAVTGNPNHHLTARRYFRLED